MRRLSVEEGERIIIRRVAKLIVKLYELLGFKETMSVSGWEEYLEETIKAMKSNPDLVMSSTGHVIVMPEYYDDGLLDDIHITFELGVIPVRFAEELIEDYVEDVPCG